MASMFSANATLTTCASSTSCTIPKLSKSSRCPNLIGSIIVLDSNSAIKLQHYDLATLRFFHKYTHLVKARAYVEDDSGITPEVAAGGDDELREEETNDLEPDTECEEDGVEIEIEKPGKNRRIIRSKVVVQASLQTVWDILTDYERLADFIPGLAVSKLLEKRDKFARLYQIGEQNLAFGLKFNAKGTIDCFEKDLETLPFGQKRDIDFKMVEGDFQLFEGKWSVEQGVKCNSGDLQSNSIVAQEFETTLVYTVHVKPKVWLPVRLVEGRLCKEIRTNLSCIRKEAEKAFQKTNYVL